MSTPDSDIADGAQADAMLADFRQSFERAKHSAERATAQVADEHYFTPLGDDGNSLAALVKHMGGNHRSRWRDFLTTDGEKDDRHRDTEFVTDGDSRASIEALWHEGWTITFETLDALQGADLDRRVTIRGAPFPVYAAIVRSLTHAHYHVGQIVQLARHWAGDSWQTLSVPRGKTEEYNAAMRAKYGVWRG